MNRIIAMTCLLALPLSASAGQKELADTSVYPDRIVDRPLVLPKGIVEVDAAAAHVVADNGLQLGARAGITDRVDAGAHALLTFAGGEPAAAGGGDGGGQRARQGGGNNGGRSGNAQQGGGGGQGGGGQPTKAANGPDSGIGTGVLVDLGTGLIDNDKLDARGTVAVEIGNRGGETELTRLVLGAMGRQSVGANTAVISGITAQWHLGTSVSELIVPLGLSAQVGDTFAVQPQVHVASIGLSESAKTTTLIDRLPVETRMIYRAGPNFDITGDILLTDLLGETDVVVLAGVTFRTKAF